MSNRLFIEISRSRTVPLRKTTESHQNQLLGRESECPDDYMSRMVLQVFSPPADFSCAPLSQRAPSFNWDLTAVPSWDSEVCGYDSSNLLVISSPPEKLLIFGNRTETVTCDTILITELLDRHQQIEQRVLTPVQVTTTAARTAKDSRLQRTQLYLNPNVILNQALKQAGFIIDFSVECLYSQLRRDWHNNGKIVKCFADRGTTFLLGDFNRNTGFRHLRLSLTHQILQLKQLLCKFLLPVKRRKRLFLHKMALIPTYVFSMR